MGHVNKLEQESEAQAYEMAGGTETENPRC